MSPCGCHRTPLLMGAHLDMDNGEFHHLWISGFYRNSRPSASLAAVVFTAPHCQQRKPPISSVRGCPPSPSSTSPHLQTQHLLPRQSAAKLCPSLSLASFDTLPLCFGRKASISAGPQGGRFASANCQLCSVSLVLLWGSQVIPLQSLTRQLPLGPWGGTDSKTAGFLGTRDTP